MAEKGKIACLLADGFEDSEFRLPCDWLSAAANGGVATPAAWTTPGIVCTEERMRS